VPSSVFSRFIGGALRTSCAFSRILLDGTVLSTEVLLEEFAIAGFALVKSKTTPSKIDTRILTGRILDRDSINFIGIPPNIID
jgi:hypothetical protein